MPSNKLSQRRPLLKRPIVCRKPPPPPTPPAPPPPPPPPPITCSITIVPPDYPFHQGFANTEGCNPNFDVGTGYKSFTITWTPDQMGAWVVDPLNCDRIGRWEFFMPPNSGTLEAKMVYVWPNDSICIVFDTIVIP